MVQEGLVKGSSYCSDVEAFLRGLCETGGLSGIIYDDISWVILQYPKWFYLNGNGCADVME